MSKKALALTVKFVISVGLIWYLLHNIDLGSAWKRMLGADAVDLTVAGLVIFVQLIISVFRWHAVIIAIQAILPYWQTFRLYLIGLFFNQILPSSVGGDAIRIYKSYRAGLTISAAAHSVILERVATVLGLLILVAAAAPFFQNQANQINTSWMLSFSIMMLLGGIGGVVLIMCLDRAPYRFRSWKLVRVLSNLAADTRRTFLSPTHTYQVLGWGIVGHVTGSVAVYFIAKSIELNVSVLDCLVLMPPVMLVTTLPISIAGWGVREGAMVAAFALVGVPAHDALVLSILFGMMAVLFAIPGGITWLLTTDKKVETIADETHP
ncbi:MAG: flippase-like domain-containing protein [Rhodospirillales bacterium]|nr:flippase-like domain-containing protein [Rhodospirillales bacterium]